MRNIKTTVSYKWFTEVWNEAREDSIDKLMATEALAHGIIAPDQPNGSAGFKLFYHSFKDQYADIHIDIKDVICQDDMECTHAMVTATHIETGKQVKFSGLCLARIESGKIAEAWNHFDFLDLYQQLGHVLTPAAEVK